MKEPHFPVDKVFRNSSYAERYAILAQRMMEEKLYAHAAVFLTPPSQDVIVRLGRLAADFPELVEMEANPVRVLPHGAVALDARIRVSRM